jgi:hypothetical protein
VTGRGEPSWADWRFEGDAFRVGIEEEVMLLDPSWALDQGFPALRGNLEPELRGRLMTETHGSAIEYASTPAPTSDRTGRPLPRVPTRSPPGT